MTHYFTLSLLLLISGLLLQGIALQHHRRVTAKVIPLHRKRRE